MSVALREELEFPGQVHTAQGYGVGTSFSVAVVGAGVCWIAITTVIGHQPETQPVLCSETV